MTDLSALSTARKASPTPSEPYPHCHPSTSPLPDPNESLPESEIIGQYLWEPTEDEIWLNQIQAMEHRVETYNEMAAQAHVTVYSPVLGRSPSPSKSIEGDRSPASSRPTVPIPVTPEHRPCTISVSPLQSPKVLPQEDRVHCVCQVSNFDEVERSPEDLKGEETEVKADSGKAIGNHAFKVVEPVNDPNNPSQERCLASESPTIALNGPVAATNLSEPSRKLWDCENDRPREPSSECSGQVDGGADDLDSHSNRPGAEPLEAADPSSRSPVLSSQAEGRSATEQEVETSDDCDPSPHTSFTSIYFDSEDEEVSPGSLVRLAPSPPPIGSEVFEKRERLRIEREQREQHECAHHDANPQIHIADQSRGSTDDIEQGRSAYHRHPFEMSSFSPADVIGWHRATEVVRQREADGNAAVVCGTRLAHTLGETSSRGQAGSQTGSSSAAVSPSHQPDSALQLDLGRQAPAINVTGYTGLFDPFARFDDMVAAVDDMNVANPSRDAERVALPAHFTGPSREETLQAEPYDRTEQLEAERQALERIWADALQTPIAPNEPVPASSDGQQTSTSRRGVLEQSRRIGSFPRHTAGTDDHHEGPRRYSALPINIARQAPQQDVQPYPAVLDHRVVDTDSTAGSERAGHNVAAGTPQQDARAHLQQGLTDSRGSTSANSRLTPMEEWRQSILSGRADPNALSAESLPFVPADEVLQNQSAVGGVAGGVAGAVVGYAGQHGDQPLALYGYHNVNEQPTYFTPPITAPLYSLQAQVAAAQLQIQMMAQARIAERQLIERGRQPGLAVQAVHQQQLLYMQSAAPMPDQISAANQIPMELQVQMQMQQPQAHAQAQMQMQMPTQVQMHLGFQGRKGGRPQEIRPGDWFCRECDFHNFQRNPNCAHCGYPAPTKNADRVQVMGKECRFRNDTGQTKQNHRGMHYPVSGEDDRHLIPLGSYGDWYCHACKFWNWRRQIACKTCGALQTDGTTSSEGGPAPGALPRVSVGNRINSSKSGGRDLQRTTLLSELAEAEFPALPERIRADEMAMGQADD